MRGRLAWLTLLAAGVALTGALNESPAAAQQSSSATPEVVRVATFNASLNRASQGALLHDLSTPDDAQVRAVAEIIQRVRPDILLLQEFDYDAAGASLAAFQTNYLGRPQNGQAPIHYEHTFFTASNTGLPSGLDLDNDGRVGGGSDALGFGEFPGQYAMVLLSRFPIERDQARTFGKMRWRDMADPMLPDDPRTPAPLDWYSEGELALLPLSSKNHWDVPVRLGRRVLHLLISHPTPPAFDGPEDRNGRRNHDEIRFWSDYLTRDRDAYIRDDRGKRGGFKGRHFIIMGDLNSDPVDGASLKDAINGLLAQPLVNATVIPESPGGAEAGRTQGDSNETHRADPRRDTADFNDRHAGNLRVDYLLPQKSLEVCGSGVFWPPQAHAAAALVWGTPPPSSDHRLVWLDITAGAARCPPGNDPTASEPWRRHR